MQWERGHDDDVEAEGRERDGKKRTAYDVAFREQLVAAACEPGASVAQLAREHGIDPNNLYRWRRRHRARGRGEAAALLPVSVVPAHTVAAPVGTIEIRLGQAVVRVEGAVDPATLHAVLGGLR